MNKNFFNVDLTEALELDKMPLDQQEDIIANIGEALFTAFIARSISMLKEEEKDELEKIVNETPLDLKKVESFLRSKIDDFDGMVNFIIADFKEKALAFYKAL